MLYGYARVSTTGQDTDVQKELLEQAGCTIIREEKCSGGSREGRTELETLMQFLRADDTLVVTKLDRLGRSTRDVLNLVHELQTKGCHLRVLDRNIDTAKPEGKLILTVLSMVAEMELEFIRARQAEGIAKAKAKGVYKGRPPKVDPQDITRLRAEGLTMDAIAAELGISRSGVYKAIARGKRET